MQRFRKLICQVLIICLMAGFCAVPVNASEDPLDQKDYEAFGSVDAEMADTTEEMAAPAEVEISEEVAVPEAEVSDAEAMDTQEEEISVEITEIETSAEEDSSVRNLPLFFQTDYPNTRFGSGTVADNGCSITSLAMVATYMTGHVYLPDELARYFGGRAENNIERLEMGSEALRLPHEKAENWHKVQAALRDGKIIIVLVDNRSAFTQSQHFIILTGVHENGKIAVMDSYAPNYEKWDLKKGFQEGFTEDEILCGYSGAWIYDVDAMPENPFIYSEPEPERGEPRYPDVHLTLAQEDLLAKVIWVEARGESEEGQQAVAEVVLNRLVSDRFPNNLHDVIYGEGQFRSAAFLEDAEPSQAQYEAIEKALFGPYVLPEDVYYFATFPTTEKIWGEIGGHIFCYAQN